MLRVPFAKLAIFCLLVAAFLASGVAWAGSSSLTMVSEPGDYVGGGRTYSFDGSSGQFTASAAIAVHIVFLDSVSGEHWDLDFSAPYDAPLKVGVYSGASENGGSHPTLSVYGDARSGWNTAGQFEVKKIIYGPGSSLTSFWATFEQRSAGASAALRGEIKFNADVTEAPVNRRPGVYAGNAQRVMLGTTVTLAGVALDDDVPSATSLTTQWTKASGPGDVSFSDASALTTDAVFSAGGDYLLRLTADDAELTNSASVRIVVVDPDDQTSLVMHSDPDDLAGTYAVGASGPRDFAYTLLEADFSISSYSDSFRVEVRSPSTSWWLQFGAPLQAGLKPAIYADARNTWSDPPPTLTSPRLSAFPSGVASGIRGSFEVKKIIYGANRTILSFWATFEQHVDGATPALHGEIRYHANLTGVSMNQAPAAYAGEDQRLSFGGPVTLDGFVFDDDQPGAASVTHTWSCVSGPGSATFADASALKTTALFSEPGEYVLRLTVDDTEYSASDDLRVVLGSPDRTFMAVHKEVVDYVGPDRNYFETSLTADFSVKVVRDAVEVEIFNPDTYQFWSFGFDAPGVGTPLMPGSYTGALQYPFHPDESAGFNMMGVESAGGGSIANFTVREIEVGPDGTVRKFWAVFDVLPYKHPPAARGEIRYNADSIDLPHVDAGPDRHSRTTKVALQGALHFATAETHPTALLWTVVDGPGKVTFSNPKVAAPQATFGSPGVYRLRLTASNGAGMASDDVLVEILGGPVETAVSMHSGSGDYVGAGKSYLLTTADGYFGVVSYPMRLSFESDDGSNDWDFRFTALDGGRLQPGFYNADGTGTADGFLEISGNARAVTNPAGFFYVHEVDYDAQGMLTKLWVTFEQVDAYSAKPLQGEVRFNADTAGIPFIFAGSDIVTRDLTVSLKGEVTSLSPKPAPVATRWVKVAGAGKVSFASASSVVTTATFSARGYYLLRLVVSDGSTVQSDDLVVKITGGPIQTSLTLQSDPGDQIGRGQSLFYDEVDADFSATRNDRGGISIYVRPHDWRKESWWLDFAVPGDVFPAVGVYPNAVLFGSNGATEAGLDISGTYYPTSVTGGFEVKQMVLGDQGEIRSFHATFEQHSSASASALRGEIRINAHGANSPPVADAGQDIFATEPFAVLAGDIGDDFVSAGPLRAHWSLIEGPGDVVFSDADSQFTGVNLSAPGRYRIAFDADDGEATSRDELVVTWIPLHTSYFGLIGKDGADAGTLSLQPGRGRQFTGTIRIGSKRFAIRGAFDSTGNYAGRLVGVAGSSVHLGLREDGSVDGQLVLGNSTYDLAGAGASADPRQFVGRYAFATGSSAADLAFHGYGWGRFSVNASGSVRVAGRLPDGVSFSGASRLSDGGHVALYAPASNGRSLLSGEIACSADVSSPRWRTLPSAGFDATLQFFCSPVVELLLKAEPLTGGLARVTCTFRAADTSFGDVVRALDVSPGGVAGIAPADRATFDLSIRADGIFRGGFMGPDSTRVGFSGIILSNRQQGFGLHRESAASGSVTLAPAR